MKFGSLRRIKVVRSIWSENSAKRHKHSKRQRREKLRKVKEFHPVQAPFPAWRGQDQSQHPRHILLARATHSLVPTVQAEEQGVAVILPPGSQYRCSMMTCQCNNKGHHTATFPQNTMIVIHILHRLGVATTGHGLEAMEVQLLWTGLHHPSHMVPTRHLLLGRHLAGAMACHLKVMITGCSIQQIQVTVIIRWGSPILHKDMITNLGMVMGVTPPYHLGNIHRIIIHSKGVVDIGTRTTQQLSYWDRVKQQWSKIEY